MVLSPLAIIGVNGRPVGKIVGEVSPVAAVSQFIEDPVQDLSIAVFPRAAPRQHSRTVRLQEFPLLFRQIGGVRSSFHTFDLPSLPPFHTLSKILFDVDEATGQFPIPQLQGSAIPYHMRIIESLLSGVRRLEAIPNVIREKTESHNAIGILGPKSIRQLNRESVFNREDRLVIVQAVCT